MAKRRRGRAIDAWLVLDKPQGITSTQCVSRVKALTQAEKCGHGGTLDPLATGILPIAMGEATKTVAWIMDARKSYEFTIRLGEARDTDDAEGHVVATSPLRPTDDEIRVALPTFLGEIQQRPPNFAAVKVQGERAYDLARRGEAVELEPRPVQIHALTLTGRPDADHATFNMASGKGAYVRAIARDLGQLLGCQGHVSALRRTSVGAFNESNAVSLERLAELVEADELRSGLVPVVAALAGIPSLAVTEPQALRLRAGQAIRVAARLLEETVGGQPTLMLMQAGQLVAIGRVDDGEVTPVRVFHVRGAAVARAQGVS